MDWTIGKLVVEVFDEAVITAVKLLTHDKKVPYKKYIENIKTNKIALKVKLADLEDNLDIKRIAHPKFRDYARLAEYLKYYNELKKRDWDKSEFAKNSFTPGEYETHVDLKKLKRRMFENRE